jgi:hypothetical protein
MKNSIKLIAVLGLLAVVTSSCTTVSKTTRNSTFAPDRVELRINMQDLQLLGSVEISVAYDTYLFGSITTLRAVNGEPYQPYVLKNETRIDGVNGGILSNLHLGRMMDRATYKVVEEYPDADYFQVVYTKQEVKPLFLGNEIKQTALIKAYSFKNW